MNNYKISRRNRSIKAVKRIVVVLVIFVSNTKTGYTSKTTLHVHHTFQELVHFFTVL